MSLLATTVIFWFKFGMCAIQPPKYLSFEMADNQAYGAPQLLKLGGAQLRLLGNERPA